VVGSGYATLCRSRGLISGSGPLLPFGHGAGDRLSEGVNAAPTRSGLALEAQRATIERFAAAESLTVLAEYVEAETGKGSDALDRRPQLASALAAAKAAKCSVVVTKLDRLSRDVAFVAGLMAQRVPPIYHSRAWQGRRPVRAASLRSTRRKGAPAHIVAN
jgi:Resolvase, N terminal domain